MRKLFLILALFLVPVSALAVQPDEVLDDPVLEERARDISKLLRCVVCQSESIDDSNAAIARDLRLLVRERLVEGDTNQEAIDHIVERYGEYVLFLPPFNLANAMLWLAGPLFLLLGLMIAFFHVRSKTRATGNEQTPLSAEEREKLKSLTGG